MSAKTSIIIIAATLGLSALSGCVDTGPDYGGGYRSQGAVFVERDRRHGDYDRRDNRDRRDWRDSRDWRESRDWRDRRDDRRDHRRDEGRRPDRRDDSPVPARVDRPSSPPAQRAPDRRDERPSQGRGPSGGPLTCQRDGQPAECSDRFSVPQRD